MIEAREFVEAARAHGYCRYTGVPCSFLTPLINYVINDDSLSYISSANEGDAVATAAGSVIGGEPAIAMMQNSGLGNAVSPITSLLQVFRIPVLIIASHRGEPGTTDEPQHELTGRITGSLLELMEVPWERFPTDASAVDAALQRARQHRRDIRVPYGLVMSKGSVAPCALRKDAIPGSDHGRAAIARDDPDARGTLTRSDVLQLILELTPENCTAVVATTGFTSRELYACADRPNHFYMVGSMGCASSLGLGLALARPDLKVVIVDGDGAALMRLGNFATIGTYGTNNLIHIVLDNRVHDSTGAQATVSANVDFAALALACGYAAVAAGNGLDILASLFAVPDSTTGPRFCHMIVRPGTLEDLPRPGISPVAALGRFMSHIGTTTG